MPALRLTLGLVAGLLLPSLPLPAYAHAILVRSTPAIGASVPAGPVALELHYNSRIDSGRSKLTLIRADRSETVLPIQPDPAPDVLRAGATLAPGTYVVRWQVLAIDGHITRGDVPFSVTGP